MNGIKKCSILLGIVRENNAHQLLNYLSQAEREKIFSEIEKREPFTNNEKRQVLLSFLDFFKTQKKPVFSFEIITLILIFICIASIAVLFFIADKIDRQSMEYFLVLFSQTGGIYYFTYPYLSYFTRKYYGKSPFYLAFQTKKSIFDTFFGIAGGVALFFILTVINRLVDSAPYTFNVLFYFSLFAQGLLAPVTEEVFFRKFLFSKLKNETGKTTALIIVSLCFAMVHAPGNFEVGVLLFISGLILTGLYSWRKSLLPAFVAHCIGNTLFYVVGGL